MGLKDFLVKKAEKALKSTRDSIPFAENISAIRTETTSKANRATLAPYDPTATQNAELSPLPLHIHGDISELLWILDGPKKNISKNAPERHVLEIGGTPISVLIKMAWKDEPSMISTSLPIQLDANPSTTERPPYYPRYEELTPEQRGVYWQYLKNPYDSSFNVGYAFLLYYGLERHLLCGNLENAFEVILKMRDVFSNKSFQSYSANALILSCATKNRGDLLAKFMRSLDKEHEYQFDRNLFLICKAIEGTPLTAKEMMVISNAVPGCNRNYIKRYPDLYEKELNLIAPAGVTLPKPKKIEHKVELKVFANTSLSDTLEIPDLLQDPAILSTLSDILSKTHENTKKRLASMRKAGTAPTEKTVDKKEIVVDWKLKKQLESEYDASKPGSLDRHFAINSLIDFYYKLRDLGNEYLDKCIELCKEDIAALDALQENYRIEQIANIAEYRSIMGNELADRRTAETEMEFKANIPAFKRLAIIYEKKSDYESAEAICREAIHYYAKYGVAASVEEFIERQAKLAIKKAKKKD